MNYRIQKFTHCNNLMQPSYENLKSSNYKTIYQKNNCGTYKFSEQFILQNGHFHFFCFVKIERKSYFYFIQELKVKNCFSNTIANKKKSKYSAFKEAYH